MRGAVAVSATYLNVRQQVTIRFDEQLARSAQTAGWKANRVLGIARRPPESRPEGRHRID